MDTNINFSTSNVKPITFDGTEVGYQKFITDARNHILNNGGKHFRNCIFEVNDLKKIAAQKETFGGNVFPCKYLFFSPICCTVNNKIVHTLLASGIALSFLWKQGRILYASLDVNHILDYSKLPSFDHTNLDFIPDGQPNTIVTLPLVAINSFDKWLLSYEAQIKDYIRKGTPLGRQITWGIYYPIDKLNDFKLLDTNPYSRVAFFPIPISSTDNSSSAETPLLYTITYIVASIDNNDVIQHMVFPSQAEVQKKLLYSQNSWPRKWSNRIN